MRHHTSLPRFLMTGLLLLAATSWAACGDDDSGESSNNGGLLTGDTTGGDTSGDTRTGGTTDGTTGATSNATTSNATTSNATTGGEPDRVGPEYSGGACPALVDGVNSGFESGGLSRSFILDLPPEPNGAPVIFLWHWLSGSAAEIHNGLNFDDLSDSEGVIVVAPESQGSQFEWRFTQGPEGNPDLALFDDLLACLWDQYDADLDRIYATGMSAGGLWSSYLTLHRSQWLATTAPMSGGADTTSYQTPEVDIPVLMIWGGEGDVFQGGLVDFDETSKYMSTRLREDGHFVAHCVHDRGHLPPFNAAPLVWSWFEAHSADQTEEPFKDGLPATFPDICALP